MNEREIIERLARTDRTEFDSVELVQLRMAAHELLKEYREQWKFCRPYTTPLKLIFTHHDGDLCPVELDEDVILKLINGEICVMKAINVEWEIVTGYMRIKL